MKFWLSLSAIASLFIVSELNHEAGFWALNFVSIDQPDVAINILLLGIPALLVISAIYFLLQSRILSDYSKEEFITKKRTWIIAGASLFVSAIFLAFVPLGFRHLNAYDFVHFVVIGPITEELLFRGIIFSLALRVFSNRGFAQIPYAIWFSTVFFALTHVQYHEYQLSTEVFLQILMAIPIGIALGFIRLDTGRVWPAVIIHSLLNWMASLQN